MSQICERFELLMPEALSGRLEAAQQAELEAHCELCADCRATWDSFGRTAELLAVAFPQHAQSRVAMPKLWRGIERAIRAKSVRLPSPPTFIPAWAPVAAVAAMIILALLLFIASPRASTQPSPARMVQLNQPNVRNHNTAHDLAAVKRDLPSAVIDVPAAHALPEEVVSAELPVPIPEEPLTSAPAPAMTPPAPLAALAPPPAVATARGTREVIDDSRGLALLRATGPVAVFDATHQAWREIVAGERASYGAPIRTAAGALAEFAFGESRVRIDEKSEVSVAFLDDSEKSPRVAALSRGRIRVDLLHSERPFLIRSGGGTVELTGTVVDVDAPAADVAFVLVLEGHIKVTPASVQPSAPIAPIAVVAGQEALVANKGHDEMLSAALKARISALANSSVAKMAGAAPTWAAVLDHPPSPKHAAVGQLIVKDEHGRDAEPLKIDSIAVKAQIRGPESITRIDECFYNSTNSTLEGTFFFPVPPGAAISRFAMYVTDTTLVEGEVVERGRARAIYESILHAKRDPALLEWVDGNTFKARVFPIQPHSVKRIIMEYTQLLPAFFDTRRYVFPLVSEMTDTRDIGRLSIQVDLATGDHSQFGEIASPSYASQTQVVGVGDSIARAAFTAEHFRPGADFVLTFSAPRPSEMYSAAYAENGESPYVLLGYQPRPELHAASAHAMARDILFIAETSGARTPQDLTAQRQAIGLMVAALNPNDRVMIAAADVNLVRLNPAWLPSQAAGVDGLSMR